LLYPRRIGKTSRVFRTTDTRHSDNYAPTGLLGPFRGRFQAWRTAGRLAARNRPRDRRDAGERVRLPDPSRPAFLDAVSTRRVERPALADPLPTPRAATRRALLSVCRAVEPVRVCEEIPGSGAPRRAPRSPTGFASDRRMLGIAAHQPRTPSAGDRPRPCGGAARQSSRDGGADRSRAFEEWLEVLTHGVVEECLFWLVAFVRNRNVVAGTGLVLKPLRNRRAGSRGERKHLTPCPVTSPSFEVGRSRLLVHGASVNGDLFSCRSIAAGETDRIRTGDRHVGKRIRTRGRSVGCD
jgi:hypothetical protein